MMDRHTANLDNPSCLLYHGRDLLLAVCHTIPFSFSRVQRCLPVSATTCAARARNPGPQPAVC